MSMPNSAATPERILLRLDWNVIRRLDGLLQGDYRSLFYGFGVDFADLREYQPQDDIRYIDWNVTARMNTPYVRQYHEDREITAWFLLDMSPSVDFGTRDAEKRTMLIEFVSVLARLLTRHGNRVGAMMFGSSIQHTVPARSGKVQVLRMINDMLRQPRLSQTSRTDLRSFFTGALHSIKRRSLVFVISDFISEPHRHFASGSCRSSPSIFSGMSSFSLTSDWRTLSPVAPTSRSSKSWASRVLSPT